MSQSIRRQMLAMMDDGNNAAVPVIMVERSSSSSLTRYQYEYTVYRCSYKEGMEDLVANRGIKAVLMGVRRGDPFTGKYHTVLPTTTTTTTTTSATTDDGG